MTEKNTKSRTQNEPKILLARKDQGKGKLRARRKKGGEVEKATGSLLVFMLTSLKIVFERKKLFQGRALFWL